MGETYFLIIFTFMVFKSVDVDFSIFMTSDVRVIEYVMCLAAILKSCKKF